MSSNNTNTGSRTGCRGPTAGMTLWEAILIVAVVAIVVVILLPVFNRPHGCGTRKSTCVNNMKSLATAMNLYQIDYDSTYPSSYLYNRSKTWNRSDFINFASKMGDVPPRHHRTQSRKTLMMVLFDHIMKSKDVVWCPSDPNCGNYHANATISYFYKAANDRAWYAGWRKEKHFAYPSDQVMFYERAGWHWGDEKRGFQEDVTLNMVYMDGHVSARRIVDSSGPAANLAPRAGEPAYYNTVGETNKRAPDAARKAYFDPNFYNDAQLR